LKHSYLHNFRSLDPQTFESLMRHLGFAAAVCFRKSGEAMVQVLRMESEAEWPAAVEFNFDYTSAVSGLPPLGWTAPGKVPNAPAAWRNLWPKGATLYFPEQALYGEQLLFAVVNAPGKRARPGEMSGALEAVAARMRRWYEDQTGRQAITDAGLAEHVRTLGIDLTRIIDHELRTPLASVSGYASLLKDVDPVAQKDLWQEYWSVLEAEAANAIEAVDKLSLALHSEGGGKAEAEAPAFDAEAELRALCDEALARAVEIAGEDLGRRVHFRVRTSADQTCALSGSRKLFRGAVWEVLKNAMSHTRSGKVDVVFYASGLNLVIDVTDDGVGVSAGSEELIFLRFYQDPGAQEARKGKRGLGLGLFLARHIAERHLGQLTFVRQRGGTLFRFVWPMAKEADTDLSASA
jgi:signal transduction histidine kinase